MGGGGDRGAAKFFQAYPNLSKENPSLSKLFARKFQTISLAIPREIKDLMAQSWSFSPFVGCQLALFPASRARKAQLSSSVDPPSLSRHLVFPKTMSQGSDRAVDGVVPGEARQANEPARDLCTAALSSRRRKSRLDVMTERSQ